MQLKLEQQLEDIRVHLLSCLSIDFGHIWITEEIADWPSLSWSAFVRELGDQEINLSSSLNRSWQSFFTIEKEKYCLLKLLVQSGGLNGGICLTSYINSNN